MEDSMMQTDCSVFIAAGDLPHVFAAIKELMDGASEKIDGHFAWVDTEQVLNAGSVAEQLIAWRWEPELDDAGNIVDLFFTGDKLGDDLLLFEAIAPYVKAGSFIEMFGEAGEFWQWRFDDAGCKKKSRSQTAAVLQPRG